MGGTTLRNIIRKRGCVRGVRLRILKQVNLRLSIMKSQHFNTFLEALIKATGRIQPKYFLLPVAYKDKFVYRERAYCYELYHQIRNILPQDYPYLLSGEVNKAGHPLIAGYCGSIIPDFLVHKPGNMSADDNLVIVEVKTIQGANFYREHEVLLKDIQTIKCMTTILMGYYRGIILIFGSNNHERKDEICRIFSEKCDSKRIILLFHNNPLENTTLAKF